MDESKLQNLHEKFISDQMLPEDLQEWKAAVSNPEMNLSIEELMNNHWQKVEVEKQAYPSAQRHDELYQAIVSHPRPKQPVLPRWRRIALAAAVAIIIVSVGLLYFRNNEGSKIDKVTYETDINPGVEGATLTLASGRKIRLSDVGNGELAKEHGVVITKSADGKLIYEVKGSQQKADGKNTLSTAKGQTYQVRLPDGSKVYLNAASSLTYSANLMEQGKRVVRLRGEAFFEVAKVTRPLTLSTPSFPANRQSRVRVPFIVETESQHVEVLGTHFNVMAYKDEPAEATTLVEGSVRVSAVTQNTETILRPGQQSLNKAGSITVSAANLENSIDWKEGDFFLNHVNFKTAMRKIERWYDVKMIYDKSVPDDIESGGWISRDRKLSAVLKLIESTGQVHFKVEGRNVYVSK